jgi:hypothetical protein
MARGTEEQEQASDLNPDFPYRALMNHPAWRVIDQALGELEANDDVELRTARRYVIGYLLQQLATKGLTPPAIAVGPDFPQVPLPSYNWILQLQSAVERPVAAKKSPKRLVHSK